MDQSIFVNKFSSPQPERYKNTLTRQKCILRKNACIKLNKRNNVDGLGKIIIIII